MSSEVLAAIVTAATSTVLAVIGLMSSHSIKADRKSTKESRDTQMALIERTLEEHKHALERKDDESVQVNAKLDKLMESVAFIRGIVESRFGGNNEGK